MSRFVRAAILETTAKGINFVNGIMTGTFIANSGAYGLTQEALALGIATTATEAVARSNSMNALLSAKRGEITKHLNLRGLDAIMLEVQLELIKSKEKIPFFYSKNVTDAGKIYGAGVLTGYAAITMYHMIK